MLLGIIIAIALTGLAAAGNWPKILRVALAFGVYSTLLVVLCRGRPSIRLGAFILAGATSGAVSGVVRQATSVPLILVSVVGAGLLLSPLHWWALRTWQRLARDVQ